MAKKDAAAVDAAGGRDQTTAKAAAAAGKTGAAGAAAANANGKPDLSQAPPFTLADLRAAIPAHCWRKSAARSLAHAAFDLAAIAALAYGAWRADSWLVWPAYWLLQGTLMWALFCVGHDCGHGSFSDSRALNDAVGHLAHSLILVPYHGWRLSHKKHHGNHGHVDNDESWHPVTKSQYDALGWQARLGRLTFPAALVSFPFYLIWGSPGRAHSHYHPHSDLFSKHQRPLVVASDAWLVGAYSCLIAAAWRFGVAAVAKVYLAPWLVFVAWLDAVTYLHHHGPADPADKLPWYRGAEWSFLRGGLTALDRDYGVFHRVTHDIGTHVVHHLFPQIPHYRLREATAAVKPILGPYYREPAKAPWHGLPTQLLAPLARSFAMDRWVPDEGEVVFYTNEAEVAAAAEKAAAAAAKAQ